MRGLTKRPESDEEQIIEEGTRRIFIKQQSKSLLRQNVHNINNRQQTLDLPDAFAVTAAKVQSNTNTVAMETHD